MSGRHHRKGVLTGLGKPGLHAHKKKKSSPVRTVFAWAGGAVIIVFFAVMIGALGIRMFNPEVGERSDEGDYEILEIRDDPRAVAPETRAVAVAVVTIRGRSAFVPITAEQKGTVAVGDTIHVQYTSFPNLGMIRVDGWERK